MQKVFLSTVTPVYQGAPYLEELVKELAAVRDELAQSDAPLQLFESVFVNDGARDNSAEVLARLAEAHDWVRVVELSRNYGQHPATIAGVLHASGDWIGTLDEDLQHRPADLVPLLLKAIETDSDIVYARPRHAVHRSLVRDWGSRFSKKLVSWLSGNPNTRKFNSFRMMRGGIARAGAAVCGHDTYFDVVLGWFTTRVEALELTLNDQRFQSQGASGYSFRSLLRHARRLLVSSELKVLRLGALVGLLAVLVSVALGVTTVVLRIFWPETIAMQGWASLVVIILMMGGISCLLLGILLELVGGLFQQAQGRPTYFVVDRSKDQLLRPMLQKGAP